MTPTQAATTQRLLDLVETIEPDTDPAIWSVRAATVLGDVIMNREALGDDKCFALLERLYVITPTNTIMWANQVAMNNMKEQGLL